MDKVTLILKFLAHLILYCTLTVSHISVHHSGVLLMTFPQELCHQPEVNRFLNITSPLPAGPVSVYVFAHLLPMREPG